MIEFSYKNFTNKTFLDTVFEKGTVIKRSCFYQEIGMREVFPADSDITFIECNLDNCIMPKNCIVIKGTNKEIQACWDVEEYDEDEGTTPTADWIFENGKPVKCLNPFAKIKDAKNIPKSCTIIKTVDRYTYENRYNKEFPKDSWFKDVPIIKESKIVEKKELINPINYMDKLEKVEKVIYQKLDKDNNLSMVFEVEELKISAPAKIRRDW